MNISNDHQNEGMSDQNNNAHERSNSILKPFPIEQMVAAPLIAVINAQKLMNDSLIDFIDQVSTLPDGKPRTIDIPYRVPRSFIIHEENNPEKASDESLEMGTVLQIPFLSVSPMPNLAIDSVDIEFDLRVDSIVERSNSDKEDTSLPEFKAVVVHKSKETNRHDSSSRFSFKLSARKQEAPEGLLRIIDILNQTAVIPRKKPDAQ